jgi:Zn-dependent protease
VAAYEIGSRQRSYTSPVWNVLEYLALFVIVMLHEFGHALACRQVGGVANQIVLWPMGGVAYVNPPPRPGATLWSIAAGPLVNVALIPVLLIPGSLLRSVDSPEVIHNVLPFLRTVFAINLILLLFNMLPAYPLDGGQILRCLLWFFLGRGRSLLIAAIIGIIGAGGLLALALWQHSVWKGILSVYLLATCWGGFQRGRALLGMEKLPRREGYSCPVCKNAPPMGEYWRCSACTKPFDTFQSLAICPNCSKHFSTTACLDCGRANPIGEWAPTAATPPAL